MRPALLRAYRDTRYEVAGIEIRVGRRCPAMDRLLLSHRVHTGVFITAYNPFSRLMPLGWNQRMQARLRQAVRRRPVLPAQGSLRRWTEAHLLVLGDLGPMRKLARYYRQYGIVIVRRGQPAWLIFISSAGLCGKSLHRESEAADLMAARGLTTNLEFAAGWIYGNSPATEEGLQLRRWSRLIE